MRYASRQVVIGVVLAALLSLNVVMIWLLLSRDSSDTAATVGEVGARSSAPTPTKAPPTKASPTKRAATKAARTTPAPTSEPVGATTSDPRGGTTSSRRAIELSDTYYVARPFEAVQVPGTYRGAARGTELQLQLHDGQRWVLFPLPATTDRAGQFTAHVEWGVSGRFRVRAVDPRTRSQSPVATLLIL